MSNFERYDEEKKIRVRFSPTTGGLVAVDENDYRIFIGTYLPKADAINLASKLLQWGTSS